MEKIKKEGRILANFSVSILPSVDQRIEAGKSRSFHHISEIAGIQTVDIVVSLVLAIPTVSYDGHLHSPTVKYTVVAIDP